MVIPNGWELRPIGDFLEFKNGLNKGKEYFGYGTPIVNYMDVYHHRGLHASDIQGRVSLDSDEIRRFAVRKGDVFFTRTSETPDEVGLSCVLLDELPDGVFSGFVLRGRPKNNELNLEYCKYCFSTESVREEIVRSCTYTTRALTNGNALSSINVLVPPAEEQNVIAEAIGDIDSLIESLSHQLQKQQLMRLGIIEHLYSELCIAAANGSDCKSKRIGEYAQCVRGVSYKPEVDLRLSKSTDTLTLLRANNIQDNRYDPRDVQYVTSSIVNDSQRIKQGDILVCMANGSRRLVGKSCLFDTTPQQLTFGAFMAVLRTEETVCLPAYLHFLLETNAYSRYLGTALAGSSINNLRPSDLEDMVFPLPSIGAQNEVISILTDSLNEILVTECKLEKYRAIRQGMMRELLTGHIRLVQE